jgi:hypothetical protein
MSDSNSPSTAGANNTLYQTACGTSSEELGALLRGPKVDIMSATGGTTYIYSVSLAMLRHFCNSDAFKDLIRASSVTSNAAGQSQVHVAIQIAPGRGAMGLDLCRDALQRVVSYMSSWCTSGGMGDLGRNVRLEFSEWLDEYGEISDEERREVVRVCGLLGLAADNQKLERMMNGGQRSNWMNLT